jgi:hypothetical protein
MKKIILIIVAGIGILILLFLVIQLIPVPRTNPPEQTQLQWDSPHTQELATRACLDCHSNETRWPWYSKVAPVSWLVAFDVYRGRRALNFSEMNANPRFSREANRLTRIIQEGEMPPSQYLILHPDAKLTDQEKQELADGMTKTLQNTLGSR